MNIVHQISNLKKEPLYLLFVDLTAAFDRIPTKWVFDLVRYHLPESETVKLFDILGKLYQNISLTYQEAQIIFLVT